MAITGNTKEHIHKNAHYCNTEEVIFLYAKCDKDKLLGEVLVVFIKTHESFDV